MRYAGKRPAAFIPVATSGLMLLYLALPTALVAQATRADSLAEAQAEKAQHLGVEGPSTAERIFVRVGAFDTSTVYPWAGTIYPGTGIALGVGVAKRWGRPARVDLLAAVSTDGATFLEATARRVGMADGHFDAVIQASHTSVKDIDFFGLGPDAPLASPLGYDYRFWSVTGSLLYHPTHWLELSGGYQRLATRSELDGPGVSAPGLGEDLTYDVLQFGATVDWRTTPGYSTSGGSQRVTWSDYLPTGDRPFGFHQLEYEGTQLVPLLNEQYVLAFRALATLTTPAPGDTIPAVLSPTLGGATTLRGYETRRFTDRNRLVLSGEYRWRPSRWIDMVLFGDAGKVERLRENLGLSNLETDWGVGMRIHSLTSGGLRLDVAKGREGWETVLTMGGPF